MASINITLFFLLATLASFTVPIENAFVTYPPSELKDVSDNLIPMRDDQDEGTNYTRCDNFALQGPVACPPNSHYEECSSICEKTCCPYACPNNCCKEGCFCDEGYFKGPEGTCIAKDQCPADYCASPEELFPDLISLFPDKECPPREWYTCSAHCQRRCEKSWDTCYGWCVPGCECVPPLVRGPGGNCISSDECPKALAEATNETRCYPLRLEEPVACPPNSRYEECGSICVETCCAYTCRNNCCIDGCFCDEGYVKGPEGTCIEKDQCPTDYCDSLYEEVRGPLCYGINEVYNLRPQLCEDDCFNYRDEEVVCRRRFLPFPKCRCKEGLVRAPAGSCIKPEKCPRHEKVLEDCTRNEIHKTCGTACELNCTTYKARRIPPHMVPEENEENCPDKRCVVGCFCRQGYIRASSGRCVPPFECWNQSPETIGISNSQSGSRSSPSYEFVGDITDIGEIEPECGPDEAIRCYSHCQKNCTNYSQAIPCTMICVKGCVCKEPKIRGPDGSCILPQDCPNIGENEPECGPEEAIRCYSHCQKNCTNYSQAIACPMICVKGCVCKEPKIRGPDGSCILPQDCPNIDKNEPECGPEEAIRCYSHCQKNCSNYSQAIPCTMICVKGCVCKEPKIRGPDGSCILPQDCPSFQHFTPDIDENEPECGPEEVIRCYSHCQKNCTNYSQAIACPMICVKGCVCTEPKIRGPDGSCILPQDCPSLQHFTPELQPICPENEEYKECGTVCPKNCNNYDKNVVCPEVCGLGCFCKDPMIRGPDGKCISIEECSDIRKRLISGNATMPKKVLPHFPKLKCNENQEFSFCASICPDNCSNYRTDRICKHICMPGCKCRDGYVKADDGACIKKEDCTDIKTHNDCPALEYYDDCGPHCEADCYNYNIQDRKCEDKSCKNGCFCKPGYVRSPDRKCVLPGKCPAAP